MRLHFLIPAILAAACTKQAGVNPETAYGDRAMADSCNAAPYSYRNENGKIYSGSSGPHGEFRLRFNSTALTALTDNGKLPQGQMMPEGSLVVKDVTRNGSTDHYALMFKRNGKWLWGEIRRDGSAIYSVKAEQSVCTGCHGQWKSRDYLRSFEVY